MSATAPSDRRRLPQLQPARGSAAEVVYGTVVCAGVIGAATQTELSSAGVAAAVLGTVFVYWLAHAYVEVISTAFRQEHETFGAIVNHAVGKAFPLLAASLLPLAVLLLAELLGAERDTAVFISLWTTVALLFGWGYIAARRAGGSPLVRLIAGAAAATLGVIIATLQAALH